MVIFSFFSLSILDIYVSLYFHTHTLIMKFHFSSSKWTAHIISLIHLWMNDDISCPTECHVVHSDSFIMQLNWFMLTCSFQFGAVYVIWIVEYQFAFKIYMHHPQTVNLSCVFFFLQWDQVYHTTLSHHVQIHSLTLLNQGHSSPSYNPFVPTTTFKTSLGKLGLLIADNFESPEQVHWDKETI